MAIQTIKIRLTEWDKPRLVSKTDYIKAKTKQLREFGYEGLSEAHVTEQLEKVLAGHGSGDLTVIGLFMRDEVQS